TPALTSTEMAAQIDDLPLTAGGTQIMPATAAPKQPLFSPGGTQILPAVPAAGGSVIPAPRSSGRMIPAPRPGGSQVIKSPIKPGESQATTIISNSGQGGQALGASGNGSGAGGTARAAQPAAAPAD